MGYDLLTSTHLDCTDPNHHRWYRLHGWADLPFSNNSVREDMSKLRQSSPGSHRPIWLNEVLYEQSLSVHLLRKTVLSTRTKG
ncbi:hypothetical protein GO755_39760 [Spirosoma sp. HMF4905]|uniref:Uncharacterized protein n=1 Tax=Spirosoma arboris TaxID=2682092 RepID=A0A7K1SQY1_9BACT|nr:hypothetical protein [Spirosoma arboris]